MMNKKGVELGMNAIIIATLALIVLVVLVLLFSGKLQGFGEGVEGVSKSVDPSNCNIPGYRTCVPSNECGISESISGCDSGGVCCLVKNLK